MTSHSEPLSSEQQLQKIPHKLIYAGGSSVQLKAEVDELDDGTPFVVLSCLGDNVYLTSPAEVKELRDWLSSVLPVEQANERHE